MGEFNFGPISRTVDASTGKGNAINFASLPLHEAITALLAAENRDEFVAWLWHDLFKPLFWWKWNASKNKFDWVHCPNNKQNDPLNVEAHWAAVTGVPSGLVETHHFREQRKFTHGEPETVNNEFDQVAIGREARFLQLSFLAEPATHTALLRAVIADAFMEVVTQAVARAVESELAKKSPTFHRVRYVFDFQQASFSNPPTHREIGNWADRYAIQAGPGILEIYHAIPVNNGALTGQCTVDISLTADPPTKEQYDQGVIHLVELLTVYQDSRTILMGIPQFLQVDVEKLKDDVKSAAEQRLKSLDVRVLASMDEIRKQSTVQDRVNQGNRHLERAGQDIDLLGHVFAEQVNIRPINSRATVRQVRDSLRQVRDSQGKTLDLWLLSDIVAHPIELMTGKSRRCRFCGTAFDTSDSSFPPGEASVGHDFTDIEHVGFSGDICPMCRIYMLNSHKSRTPTEKSQGIKGDRKAYRGAFALLAPSSHFTYREDACHRLEQPPLDVGGRFASPLQRATVNLQEYSLFNLISRRIIASLWAELDAGNRNLPLPLPYLGAILFTQDQNEKIRALFDRLEALFESVELLAYPFRVTVQPAVELAFEMVVNDRKQHHTKHTYLKTSPTIVGVDPGSKFTLLVDNGLQMEVSRQFFEDRKRLQKLLGGIRDRDHQRHWLLSVLQGADPVTAADEAFSDSGSLWAAEHRFWDTQLSGSSLAEQWQQYEQVRDEVRRIVAAYPMLIEFFAKPQRR
jgi:hypothetical protein